MQGFKVILKRPWIVVIPWQGLGTSYALETHHGEVKENVEYALLQGFEIFGVIHVESESENDLVLGWGSGIGALDYELWALQISMHCLGHV